MYMISARTFAFCQNPYHLSCCVLCFSSCVSTHNVLLYTWNHTFTSLSYKMKLVQNYVASLC